MYRQLNINRVLWGKAYDGKLEDERRFGSVARRKTISQVLPGQVVRSGLLTRVQGTSTYVAKPRIPIFSKGFRADIINTGQEAKTTILSYSEVTPSQQIAQTLSLDADQTAFELRRVIFANDDPIILETVYFPINYGRLISEQTLLTTSLLDVFPTVCHTILKKAMESYEPILLTSEEAELLDAVPKDLAILDQAVTYDISDKPVFVSKALIRRDRARILTEVTFHI